MDPHPQTKPPKSVAESWIWYVLNPQIDFCAFELELLPRSLSYRPWKGLERLMPLREALLPGGKTVFDDMHGEWPEYDQTVREHDEALLTLAVAAESLFKALVASSEMREEVDRKLQTLKQSNKPSAREPGSLQEEPTWLIYEAANVVNNLPADLGDDHIDHRLWNNSRDAFVALAPPELIQACDEARKAFGNTVQSTRSRLIQLRRELSRSLDIPLVPTR